MQNHSTILKPDADERFVTYDHTFFLTFPIENNEDRHKIVRQRIVRLRGA